MQMTAENAKSEEKLHRAVNRMSKACDNFHLTISTKRLKPCSCAQFAPGCKFAPGVPIANLAMRTVF